MQLRQPRNTRAGRTAVRHSDRRVHAARAPRLLSCRREMRPQVDPPDVILALTPRAARRPASSPAAAVPEVGTRVVGMSADESSASLEEPRSEDLLLGAVLLDSQGRFPAREVEVDDRFVGDGYGVPTAESREAIELWRERRLLFLDPTYTSKAMAGLIARVRQVNSTAPDDAFLAHRRPGRTLRMTSITFLGAAQTVTGSKYLLDTGAVEGARGRRPVSGAEGAARAQLAGPSHTRRAISTRSC